MVLALGLIETKGMVGLVEATDAMCKAADVTLERDPRDRRRVRHGHRARRRGERAGRRGRRRRGRAKVVGEFVASHVIPRPHDGLIQGMAL